ncbi:MAG: hypothetical protein JWQ95_2419 [Sphaerisporangium sp.]|nr:hypothetical protein [Sphaerisporangium sp.]
MPHSSQVECPDVVEVWLAIDVGTPVRIVEDRDYLPAGRPDGAALQAGQVVTHRSGRGNAGGPRITVRKIVKARSTTAEG